MKCQVGVIHHGVGNTVAITNLLKKIGVETVIVDSHTKLSQLGRSDLKLIIPGVGSFDAGMRSLQERDLVSGIRSFAQDGGRILGICLGMQLLFDGSAEGELHGIGLLSGTLMAMNSSSEFRVPNVGWQKVTQVKECSLLESVVRPVFYHNHSFALASSNHFTAATIEHERNYSAIVQRSNVFGVQFHPEKSHSAGERLIRNFINL
jgi:glutamine amidotransferase